MPILTDNIAYLLVDGAAAAAVDPAVPAEMVRAAIDRGVAITAVLTTHKHWDHASGNAEMAANLPGAPIYGSAVDPPPAITHPLTPPTPFKWGTLTITPHGAAAHTIGSLLYHVTSPTDAAGVLFTGDTLFTAGCGRFFEGTPAAMVAAAATIRGLPSATRVYGGHEYTAANVAFGRAVEPGNADLAALEGAVRVKRARGELCVPSCVGAEGGWNVFCRTAVAGVAAAVGGGGEEEVMAKLRSWKNRL